MITMYCVSVVGMAHNMVSYDDLVYNKASHDDMLRGLAISTYIHIANMFIWLLMIVIYAANKCRDKQID